MKSRVILSQLQSIINQLHSELVAMKIKKNMKKIHQNSSSSHISDSKWFSVFLRVSTGMYLFVFLPCSHVFVCVSPSVFFAVFLRGSTYLCKRSYVPIAVCVCLCVPLLACIQKKRRWQRSYEFWKR